MGRNALRVPLLEGGAAADLARIVKFEHPQSVDGETVVFNRFANPAAAAGHERAGFSVANPFPFPRILFCSHCGLHVTDRSPEAASRLG